MLFAASGHYTGYDRTLFTYSALKNTATPCKAVLIALHGISGHSGDYANLANYLCKNAPHLALYAPNLRSQGYDPRPALRGDIASGEEWVRDLECFLRFLSSKHPSVPFFLIAESMGTLIASQALLSPVHSSLQCKGLILLSPILGIEKALSPAKRFLFSLAASLFPRWRITLESLDPKRGSKVTNLNIHTSIASQNPWYVPSFTLRLLRELATLSTNLWHAPSSLSLPLLVLYAQHDIFTSPECVARWLQGFPKKMTHARCFKRSHHLLMYDIQKNEVFDTMTTWLTSFLR